MVLFYLGKRWGRGCPHLYLFIDQTCSWRERGEGSAVDFWKFSRFLTLCCLCWGHMVLCDHEGWEAEHSCGEATGIHHSMARIKICWWASASEQEIYTQILQEASYSPASRRILHVLCLWVVPQPADCVLISRNLQNHTISLPAPTFWYISLPFFVPFCVSRALGEQELSFFQAIMIITCSLSHKQNSFGQQPALQ